MVLTNLEIKFEQTDSAINYLLKYLLFADDHKICQNEIVSHPPTSASLCSPSSILPMTMNTLILISSLAFLASTAKVVLKKPELSYVSTHSTDDTDDTVLTGYIEGGQHASICYQGTCSAKRRRIVSFDRTISLGTSDIHCITGKRTAFCVKVNNSLKK